MLGTPQHRVSERGSSLARGAGPSHEVLAYFAELESAGCAGGNSFRCWFAPLPRTGVTKLRLASLE